MGAARQKPIGLVLPALFGATGGFLNGLLLWLQVPEKVVDFKPEILACGALHGAILAACGIAAANVALRHPRLCPLIWLAAGYVAGWLSWVPTHWLVADNPLIKALVWPLTLDKPLEVAWRPLQHFGLVALLLAAALTLAPPALMRRGLAPRGLAIAAGVLGSLWFWGLFQDHARLGYFALLHGTIWGLLVGAGIARGRAPEEFAGQGPTNS